MSDDAATPSPDALTQARAEFARAEAELAAYSATLPSPLAVAEGREDMDDEQRARLAALMEARTALAVKIAGLRAEGKASPEA